MWTCWSLLPRSASYIAQGRESTGYQPPNHQWVLSNCDLHPSLGGLISKSFIWGLKIPEVRTWLHRSGSWGTLAPPHLIYGFYKNLLNVHHRIMIKMSKIFSVQNMQWKQRKNFENSRNLRFSFYSQLEIKPWEVYQIFSKNFNFFSEEMDCLFAEIYLKKYWPSRGQ